MIEFQIIPQYKSNMIVVHKRIDARKNIETIKVFKPLKETDHWISEIKRKTLIEQVSLYMANCAKVIKSGKVRQQKHQDALNELQHLLDYMGSKYGHHNYRQISQMILAYRTKLSRILPTKEDPIYKAEKLNLEEIIKSARVYSPIKNVTQI